MMESTRLGKCSKCKTTTVKIMEVEVHDVERVEIRECENCRSMEAELYLNDCTMGAAITILKQYGHDEYVASEIAEKLCMVFMREHSDAEGTTTTIESDMIETVWDAIKQRYSLPESPDYPSKKIDPKCKIDLGQVMVDVMEGGGGVPRGEGDANLIFRWPIQILAATGRIHMDKECWRLK